MYTFCVLYIFQIRLWPHDMPEAAARHDAMVETKCDGWAPDGRWGRPTRHVVYMRGECLRSYTRQQPQSTVELQCVCVCSRRMMAAEQQQGMVC